MLKKLLKYDLSWNVKVIFIFLSLGIVFTILGTLIDLIPNSLFFTVIAGICKGFSVAMFANALFNVLFRSWARNVTNLYKDESYLTHTLPINKTTILGSKVLSQIILIVVTATLLVLAIFIMYIDKETFEYLKTLIQFTSESLNTSVFWLLMSFLLLVLIEVIFIAFCGNFGIVYGNRYNNNKMLMIVIFGAVAYFIENVILIVIFLLMSLVNEDMYNIIFNQSQIINYGFLMTVAYICMIVYTVSSIGLYLLTNKIFNKGVNVD